MFYVDIYIYNFTRTQQRQVSTTNALILISSLKLTTPNHIYMHTVQQCSLHSVGSISSNPTSSWGHESSTPTIAVSPDGQLILSSTKSPVAVSRVPSADALEQSSQYHHFSCFSFQGGNVIQLIYVQVVHGFVSPSPEKSTKLDATIPAIQTSRPMLRKESSLNLWKHCLSSPKNRGDTNWIVESPHKNPCKGSEYWVWVCVHRDVRETPKKIPTYIYHTAWRLSTYQYSIEKKSEVCC